MKKLKQISDRRAQEIVDQIVRFGRTGQLSNASLKELHQVLVLVGGVAGSIMDEQKALFLHISQLGFRGMGFDTTMIPSAPAMLAKAKELSGLARATVGAHLTPSKGKRCKKR